MTAPAKPKRHGKLAVIRGKVQTPRAQRAMTSNVRSELVIPTIPGDVLICVRAGWIEVYRAGPDGRVHRVAENEQS